MATKSTRGKSRRSHTRRPKIEVVDGHELTPELVSEWKAATEERGRHAPPDADMDWAARHGLVNVLWKRRPSKKAEARLGAIFHHVSTLNLAVSNLADYPFWSDYDGGTSRMGACALLRQLCGEHYRVALLLREIAAGIEAESRTHLQDWLKHDEAFDRIERLQEKSGLAAAVAGAWQP